MSGNERTIKFRIRDTADLERNSTITRGHYHNISACILMFDVTDKDWKENVEKWQE